MAGSRIAVLLGLILVRGKRLAVGFAHSQQFGLDLFGNRCSGQSCSPGIADPHAFGMPELFCTEVETRSRPTHAVRSGLNLQWLLRPSPFLITELLPID